MDLMKLLFCIHEIILLDKVTRIAKIERIARSRVRNIVRAIISEIWSDEQVLIIEDLQTSGRDPQSLNIGGCKAAD